MNAYENGDYEYYLYLTKGEPKQWEERTSGYSGRVSVLRDATVIFDTYNCGMNPDTEGNLNVYYNYEYPQGIIPPSENFSFVLHFRYYPWDEDIITAEWPYDQVPDLNSVIGQHSPGTDVFVECELRKNSTGENVSDFNASAQIPFPEPSDPEVVLTSTYCEPDESGYLNIHREYAYPK